ncbi:hypothetical protein [Pseudoxanthomonas sp. USHLN014]|uniref:hypothetical protein n=1 Tax=Pseudoxanthomonas sp. USHLN014 TaxID=3081297 RepID=UPI00301CA151
MTEQKEKPQPVDNSHLDAGIAARNVKAEEQKQAEKEAAEQQPDEEHEEQNEPEGSAASEADDATAQRKNKGVGKRIDELTKAREDAKRERDYWREQALRNQQPAPTQQRDEQAVDDEPKPEDFEFDLGKYNRAWYEWRKGQDDKASAAAKKQEAERERQRKFQESAVAFVESNPDFHEVISNPLLPISVEMAEVISEADNPAAVAYYLGKNPQEAQRIAEMSPAGIGRAIGRIEASLSTPAPEAPRQPTPKTVTKAPPPVTTLSGSPAVVKSLDDMSMAEYDAARRKERLSRGLR